MRKIHLFILLCMASPILAIYHADNSPLYPSIWYKPDTALTNPFLCDTVDMPEAYTMMMVYRSLQPDTILKLWMLETDSSSYSVTSTQHGTMPEIYTMYHNLSCDTAGADSCHLHIGQNQDSINRMQMYEIAYFPITLTRPQALMFQTYLALRHGITLNHSNYLSSQGKVIWNARKDKDFYHRVQGIGTDPFYHYCATKSVSMEDSLVSLSKQDTLPLYSYALIGDDDAPVDWVPYENDLAILHRRWKLHISNEVSNLFLKVNTFLLPDYSDTLFLTLLSKDNQIISYLSPVSIDSVGIASYALPSSDAHFSFASRFEHSAARAQGKNSHTQRDEDYSEQQNNFILSPNPTRGDFSLDITLASEQAIVIAIYDASGKLVRRKALSPVSIYQYNGSIETQGIYWITVFDTEQNVLYTNQLIIY